MGLLTKLVWVHTGVSQPRHHWFGTGSFFVVGPALCTVDVANIPGLNSLDANIPLQVVPTTNVSRQFPNVHLEHKIMFLTPWEPLSCVQQSLILIEMWSSTKLRSMKSLRDFCWNKDIICQDTLLVSLSCIKLRNSASGEIGGRSQEDAAGHLEVLLGPVGAWEPRPHTFLKHLPNSSSQLCGYGTIRI